MAFCENCGSPLEENLKFCPNCGTKLEAAPAAPVEEPFAEPAPAAPEVPVEEPAAAVPPVQEKIENVFRQVNDTADTSGAYSAQQVSDGKVMAVLSYFGILVLIPIFAAKDKPFARFHANQGLVLLIVDILWGIINRILGAILGGIPVLGGIWGVVSFLVGLAIFVLAILGIINAAKGRTKELPFIGAFRILK